eukprot:s5733_g1.t1
MQRMASRRDPSQLGGFAHQQVAFGSQTLRALTNVFSAQGLSSSVLYVDLATAFHHLLRQQVTGVGRQEDVQQVLQRLHEANNPASACFEGARLIGVLEQQGLEPVLLRLLRDVHDGTWYSLTGRDLVQTFRGTRPGSPLADAIFRVLMSDVAQELRQWIQQQEAYMAILQSLSLEPIFVVWANDFAVPWATSTSEALVPAVEALMKEVHKLFARRGFTINFAPGKTCAVMTFLGPGAPDLRRSYLLCSNPGIEIALHDGTCQQLHFVAKYKHLGSLFAASHSFEPQMRQRLGMARAAFQKTLRAVLGNRHYPLKLRLQFFHSLVCSRLFFGLGAWAMPTLQQMARIRIEYHTMLRTLLRHEPDEHLSTGQLLVRTNAVDVRVRLAVDRLLYARRLFQVGLSYLQQLVHLEHALCEDSWMAGLQADLQWFQKLMPEAFPQPVMADLTPLLEWWQQDSLSWKRLLRRALRKHRIQEEMMNDAHDFHSQVLSTLRSAGATFEPDVDVIFAKSRADDFPCECGRVFSTSQGLALHRRKKHGVHAPEHAFVSGATCPCECDAIQTAGPLPHFVDQRVVHLQTIEAEIQQCEEALVIPPVPFDPVDYGLRLGDALTQCTYRWVHASRERSLADMPDLIEWWTRLLSVWGDEHDEWVTSVFLRWGQYILPDIIAEEIDGTTEILLGDAFAELANLFPRVHHGARLGQLRHRLRSLQAELDAPDLPHRPVRWGTGADKVPNVASEILEKEEV